MSMTLSQVQTLVQFAMNHQVARSHSAAMRIANANTAIDGAADLNLPQVDVARFQQLLSSGDVSDLGVSPQSQLQPVQVKLVYEPKHALADSNGYVAYPDIDLAQEMFNINQAKQAYEANIKVFNALSKMSSAAKRIGE